MHDNGPPNSNGIANGTSGDDDFYLEKVWLIQPSLNRISHQGEEFRVPNKFMQVLIYLAERPGVVTRQELLDLVWPDSIVVEESLSRAIYELRKIFQDDPKHPRFIETIPKKGYRLIAEKSPAGEGVSDRIKTTAASPTMPLSAPGPQITKHPTHRVLIAMAIVVLVTVVLVGKVVEWGDHQEAGGKKAVGSATASTLRLTSRPGREFHPALSPEGDRLAYVWNGGRPETKAVFVQTVGEEQPLCLTTEEGWYYFPEWTHDSRHIAFVRMAGQNSGLFLVPATGGVERKLLGLQHGALPVTPTFSPDGRWLTYAAPSQPDGPLCLFRLSLANGEPGETDKAEQLTTQQKTNHLDLRPRYSPDGTKLAFIHAEPRRVTIALMPAEGGKIKHLEFGQRLLTDLAWSTDGKTIVFAANDGLWQISVHGEKLRMLSASATQIEDLTLASQTRLLAYSQNSEQRNIWKYVIGQADSTGSDVYAGTQMIASSRYDGLTAFSPCGSQIAFVSNRSGNHQIWLAKADGASPRQLTEVTNRQVSAPVWSPDGNQLAYLAAYAGYAEIYLLDLETERIRLVSDPDFREIAHCWSPDGESLYITSDRSGAMQLWRLRLADGAYTQEPTDGCYKALLSTDGDRIFFAQSYRDTIGILSMPAGDVKKGEKAVFMYLPEGQLVDWCVGNDGIYYCYNQRHFDENYHLALYRFDTRQHIPLFGTTSRQAIKFDVDPTGTALLFDRTVRREGDIVGIENY